MRVWYSTFLDIREQILVEALLSKLAWTNWTFWGGTESAERKILVLYAQSMPEELGICCIEMRFHKTYSLTHRDFLGALMSLGMKRDVLGDIFIQDSQAIIFVTTIAKNVILQELSSVGRASVSCQEATVPIETSFHITEDVIINVASLRLDAIISNVLHMNRKKSSALIEAGHVFVNAIEIKTSSYTMFPEDIFSIRGFGKFKLKEIAGKSKKDRFFVTIEKYT